MPGQGSTESYRVDRLGQQTVRENRIVGIADIINNNLTVGLGPQSDNIVSEVDFANKRGSKREIRMWRQVVNDLAHRSSFVGSTKSAIIEILQDINYREVAGAHVLLGGGCGRTLDV